MKTENANEIYYIAKYIEGNMIVLHNETGLIGVYSHEGDFLNYGTFQDFWDAFQIVQSSHRSDGEDMDEAVLNHLRALRAIGGKY